MTFRPVSSSFWRCDADGESFEARLSIETRDRATGEEVESPPVDLAIGSVPCPICGEPMRRVVSILDGRDWEAQFA